MPQSKEYQEGLKLAKELFGDKHGEFKDLPLPGDDDLSEELVAWLYGYLMQERPLLNTRLRLLSAIAMLTVTQMEDMLADWIKAALKYGCTKDEIREVIITMSIYAGWPVTRRGLDVAAEVFK
jgi:4-carboxymuconolactone decarboxylase